MNIVKSKRLNNTLLVFYEKDEEFHEILKLGKNRWLYKEDAPMKKTEKEIYARACVYKKII